MQQASAIQVVEVAHRGLHRLVDARGRPSTAIRVPIAIVTGQLLQSVAPAATARPLRYGDQVETALPLQHEDQAVTVRPPQDEDQVATAHPPQHVDLAAIVRLLQHAGRAATVLRHHQEDLDVIVLPLQRVDLVVIVHHPQHADLAATALPRHQEDRAAIVHPPRLHEAQVAIVNPLHPEGQVVTAVLSRPAISRLEDPGVISSSRDVLAQSSCTSKDFNSTEALEYRSVRENGNQIIPPEK